MAKKEKNSLDELLPLILGTIRLIHAHLNKKHRQDLIHLSSLQIHALGYIKDKKNPLIKEVADFLVIKPPSATSLIEGLVNDKMLKRLADKKDRRAVRLVLTLKGQKIFEVSFKQMTAHMKIFIDA